MEEIVIVLMNIPAGQAIILLPEDQVEVQMKTLVPGVATAALHQVRKTIPAEVPAVVQNHPQKVKAVHLPAGEVVRS